MKYATFKDYLEEIEGFACRGERLLHELGHLPNDDLKRVTDWMRGAFEAGRVSDQPNAVKE